MCTIFDEAKEWLKKKKVYMEYSKYNDIIQLSNNIFIVLASLPTNKSKFIISKIKIKKIEKKSGSHLLVFCLWCLACISFFIHGWTTSITIVWYAILDNSARQGTIESCTTEWW